LPNDKRWNTNDANSFCTNGVFVAYDWGTVKHYVCKGHIFSITAAVDKAAADLKIAADVKALADVKAATSAKAAADAIAAIT
jgi:hypothetical protein